MPRRTRNTHGVWLIGTVVAALAVYSVFLITMWRLGFFSFSGQDASAKVIASAIALVGALFGSLITLIGIVLKHSIDLRNITLHEEAEVRLALESDRNRRLAEEAERRLHVETAIQSMTLLSSPSGGEVPPTQRAGVILTLGELDMMPLALALTDQMLELSKLDPGTAAWLLNRALASNDEVIQNQAAIILETHSQRMLRADGGAHFPDILFTDTYFSLSERTRSAAVDAFLQLLLARPYQNWAPGVFWSLVDQLHYIFGKEQDNYSCNRIGICLQRFLQVYPSDEWLNLKAGSQMTNEVLNRLKEYETQKLDGVMRNGTLYSKALEDWLSASIKATNNNAVTISQQTSTV